MNVQCRLLAPLVLAASLVPAAPATVGAATCSTVVRRGIADPNGQTLTNGFKELAIADDGDVLFTGRPEGRGLTLYRYENGGSSEIVAAKGTMEPTGHLYDKIDGISLKGAQAAFRAKPHGTAVGSPGPRTS